MTPPPFLPVSIIFILRKADAILQNYTAKGRFEGLGYCY